MISAIIQARVGSTRLPNKVFADLCGKPLLWHIINRVSHANKIDHICIATTTNPVDDGLASWVADQKIDLFRGSEEDVLSRYYEAALNFRPDTIVRITADDPFKDPEVIDEVINLFQKEQLDFAFNNKPPSFPEGLDTEVFSMKALETANYQSKDPYEREHVTQFFYRHPEKFKQGNLSCSTDISYLRWTIDTLQDYEMAKKVYNSLYGKKEIFLMKDILDLLQKHPEIQEINSKVKRSDMYFRSEM